MPGYFTMHIPSGRVKDFQVGHEGGQWWIYADGVTVGPPFDSEKEADTVLQWFMDGGMEAIADL